MGTTLTGTTPQDTYDSLIKVTDNGPLSGTAKYLSDGLGNDSKLALSTGNIGIGTTSPSTTLHIDASGGATIRLQRTSASSNRFDVGTDGTNMEFNVRDTGSFTFGGGNVGIGTSSPASLLQLGKSSASGSASIFPSLQVKNTLATQGDGSSTFNFSNLNLSSGNGAVDLVLTTTFAAGTWAPSGQLAVTSNHPLVFKTNNTEVGRFLAGGGLTFNGDTAAANALDDYEEGTFTPSVEGSSTAGTANYYQQNGRYTKIGRVVHFQLYLAYDTGTGSGSLRIGNLPFTSANVNLNNAVSIGFFDVVGLTALNVATAIVIQNSQSIGFLQYPVGGGGTTDIAYDSAANISVSGTYIV